MYNSRMPEGYITTGGGNKTDISCLDPLIQPFVEAVNDKINRDHNFTETTFGHAAAAVATVAILEARLKSDPEVQRESVKRCAMRYVDKFGPEIIEKLSNELRLALLDEN